MDFIDPALAPDRTDTSPLVSVRRERRRPSVGAKPTRQAAQGRPRRCHAPARRPARHPPARGPHLAARAALPRAGGRRVKPLPPNPRPRSPALQVRLPRQAFERLAALRQQRHLNVSAWARQVLLDALQRNFPETDAADGAPRSETDSPPPPAARLASRQAPWRQLGLRLRPPRYPARRAGRTPHRGPPAPGNPLDRHRPRSRRAQPRPRPRPRFRPPGPRQLASPGNGGTRPLIDASCRPARSAAGHETRL